MHHAPDTVLLFLLFWTFFASFLLLLTNKHCSESTMLSHNEFASKNLVLISFGFNILVMTIKNKRTPLFFRQIIGSSLLIMYDAEICGAWMIDFAKTIPVDNGLSLDHRMPWRIGTHEDGYLSGLDNLILVSFKVSLLLLFLFFASPYFDLDIESVNKGN